MKMCISHILRQTDNGTILPHSQSQQRPLKSPRSPNKTACSSADLHSNHQPQLCGDRIKIDRHAGFVINILIIMIFVFRVIPLERRILTILHWLHLPDDVRCVHIFFTY